MSDTSEPGPAGNPAETEGRKEILCCCKRCGRFTIFRYRRWKESEGSGQYLAPQRITCPICRMWAEIVSMEDAE